MVAKSKKGPPLGKVLRTTAVKITCITDCATSSLCYCMQCNQSLPAILGSVVVPQKALFIISQLKFIYTTS